MKFVPIMNALALEAVRAECAEHKFGQLRCAVPPDDGQHDTCSASMVDAPHAAGLQHTPL
eukprot:3494072-Amphidinium_carterae.1